jgi:hypothetical protein
MREGIKQEVFEERGERESREEIRDTTLGGKRGQGTFISGYEDSHAMPARTSSKGNAYHRN